jgi:hypothetical protein
LSPHSRNQIRTDIGQFLLELLPVRKTTRFTRRIGDRRSGSKVQGANRDREILSINVSVLSAFSRQKNAQDCRADAARAFADVLVRAGGLTSNSRPEQIDPETPSLNSVKMYSSTWVLL